MYSILGQLTGLTLKHLRGSRAVGEVAELAGVSVAVWQQWEKGEHLPPPNHAEAILRGLECSEANYERAFLIAAQAAQEIKRADVLRKTGIPEFDNLVNGARSALFGHLAVANALERIASTPDLLMLVKVLRPTAEDEP